MIRLQANNKKTNKKKNDMSNIKELERKMMGGVERTEGFPAPDSTG